HRKIEISMFSFLGALLFAFPALRNSQPGTPPIGTMSDFIAFFWAEVIIALSLLSVVLRWIIRGHGAQRSPDEEARLHRRRTAIPPPSRFSCFGRSPCHDGISLPKIAGGAC